MLRDAGASRLVTSGAPRIELPAGLQVLDLLDLEDSAPEVELPRVPADALAYVMYTSGSTGTPKGVAVTHRNVVRLVRGAEYADLGPEQTWLQAAPVSFDASTLEIWAPLLNGGRLVLFPGQAGTLASFTFDFGISGARPAAPLPFHAAADRRRGRHPRSGDDGRARPARRLDARDRGDRRASHPGPGTGADHRGAEYRARRDPIPALHLPGRRRPHPARRGAAAPPGSGRWSTRAPPRGSW
jgi:hypothetical protein